MFSQVKLSSLKNCKLSLKKVSSCLTKLRGEEERTVSDSHNSFIKNQTTMNRKTKDLKKELTNAADRHR